MQKLLALAFLTAALSAQATQNLTLTTPRGAEVHVTAHLPTVDNGPVIVVAPGQSCNSKGPVFESLGTEGENLGFAVVRFEWAYCNSNPSDPEPSADLVNEIQDFQTVLTYAKSLPNTGKLLLAGKSLGSLVAYAIFAQEPKAAALALLTPVCTYTTDDDGKPLPQPQSVCDASYPKLRQDPRPVLMAMGNQDDLCLLPYLYDYLKDSKGNISTVVVGGGHSLTIANTQGQIDNDKTQHNINAFISAILNWASLN